MLVLPEAPGLGVEINEAEAAKHPFVQEPLHTRGAVLPDGTIAAGNAELVGAAVKAFRTALGA